MGSSISGRSSRHFSIDIQGNHSDGVMISWITEAGLFSFRPYWSIWTTILSRIRRDILNLLIKIAFLTQKIAKSQFHLLCNKLVSIIQFGCKILCSKKSVFIDL